VSARVKEKVSKLISLAGNNPSAEEAASATAKALELATVHGLIPRRLMASDVAKLLAEAAKNPPEKQVTVPDSDVKGLSLRVMPSGFASWSCEYTRPGVSRAQDDPGVVRARFTIGNAREVGLVEARKIALDIRAKARTGSDPHYDRVRARRESERLAEQAKVEAAREGEGGHRREPRGTVVRLSGSKLVASRDATRLHVVRAAPHHPEHRRGGGVRGYEGGRARHARQDPRSGVARE
jgi:hypothetical protein